MRCVGARESGESSRECVCVRACVRVCVVGMRCLQPSAAVAGNSGSLPNILISREDLGRPPGGQCGRDRLLACALTLLFARCSFKIKNNSPGGGGGGLQRQRQDPLCSF